MFSWVFPLITHLLAIDWMLPIALLIAIASVLKGGSTILDRIMLSMAILLGTTPVAGLLISVWPWGLAPVPVAGFAFTGVVIIAALLRRTPQFPPVRVDGDVITLGFSLVAGLSLFWTYLGQDATGRFTAVIPGGDAARHFAMVDTIRGLSGYMFMNQAKAAEFVDAGTAGGLVTYPQGGHFTAALLMSFIHSDGSQQIALHELDAFVWIVTSSYLFLCVAVLWAMRRIAGQLPLFVHAVAAFLVVIFLVWNEPLTILFYGYWAEILGLAELALLTGLIVRPLRSTKEQGVVMAALLVAIAFTYFFILPIAAAASAAWVLYYRTRVWRHRWFFASVLAVALPAASVMLYVNMSKYSGTEHVEASGGIIALNLRQVCMLGFLIVGLIATGAVWRSLTYRGYLTVLACALGFLAALGLNQYRRLGSLNYYYDAALSYYFLKATHIVVIVVVLGVGLAARRLVMLTRKMGRPTLRTPLRRVAVAGALTLSIMAMFGPLGDPRPFGRDYILGDPPFWVWPAQAAVATAREVPVDPDAMTVIWAGQNRGIPAYATAWAGSLLRNQDVNYTAEVWGGFAGEDNLTHLAEQAKSRDVYLRVVTDAPEIIAEVEQIQQDRPDLDIRYVKVVLPA
ncbi:MAG: hypothetical protein HOQ05_08115 [Corynebacteriales bacterium]|nr:hypothetical protein [Mycobacteriales bacterium]